MGFFPPPNMAWQPEQGSVRELAGYLKDALNSRDQNAQRYATMVRQPAVMIFTACRPSVLADSAILAFLKPWTDRCN